MTLKEEMIYSSNYISGNDKSIINEENEIICESIKNNSVSKFLEKQSKKIESESLKLKKSNKIEESEKAKELSKTFKEAADKIRKTEIDYKAGDPVAKAAYKRLCKKYSNLLKQKGKAAKTLACAAGVITGLILLGNAGLTALANDDIFERVKEGIEEGNLSKVIRDMKIKNTEAINSISKKISEDGLLKGGIEGIKKAKNDAWADGHNDAMDILKKPSRLFKF